MLRRAVDGVLSVVWAPRCVVCERALAQPTRAIVCSCCWKDVDRTRGHGRRVHRGQVTVRLRAIGPYDGILRQLVQALKYDRRRSLLAPLGQRLRNVALDVLPMTDTVIPVPLHWSRRWSRGFDQTAELASRLGPPVSPLLRRVRRTRPQSRLSARERERNMRGAFGLAQWVGPRPLDGRRVLVVDDVYTTGATLEACTRVLLEAGAREIVAVTLGVTPRGASRRRPRPTASAHHRP